MQLRVTILNLGNLAAQAFGGLIAAGILANMEDKVGIRAWRWLFIIEGALTVALGIGAVFILPDYPHTTAWITERERFIAERRLTLDIGESDETEDKSAFQGLKLALVDPKVWLLGLTYHATIMGLSVSFQTTPLHGQRLSNCSKSVCFLLPHNHPSIGLWYHHNSPSHCTSLDLVLFDLSTERLACG